MEPKTFIFKDDGQIPNSKHPLLVYKNGFIAGGDERAQWLEEKFASHNWSNSWRNGVYDYHHYHSITHEVLGVYNGKALLHLGGEHGEKIEVEAGDVIVIPAGVAHKYLDGEYLKVVGAYPNGSNYDLKKGKPGERPQADKNIASIAIPEQDPLFGKSHGVPVFWANL